jgi:RNA polymerase sigma-70 factor (ECF subfamily)
MEVVEQEFRYVYRLLRRWGTNHADSEDLAQEVFLVMWRRRHEVDRARSPRPWLAEVAFRLALAQRRRRLREIPSEHVDTEDPAVDLDDQLGLAQARGVFLQLLARLSPKQRAVFVLHELDELPIKDVAERLGLPLFTTYSRLRGARATFAKELRRLQLVTSTRRRALTRAFVVAAALTAAVAVLAWWPRLRRDPGSRRHVAALAAPAAPAVDLGRGVVAHWSFDEGDGAPMVRDRSGQGNDCQLRQLDPEDDRIDGVVGGAMRLPGGGWLECPATPAFDRLSGAMSISAWVMRPEFQNNLRTIVARQRGDGTQDDFYLGLSGRSVVFSSTEQALLVARSDFPTGAWFHLAAVRTAAGVVSIHLNGVETGRRSGTPPAARTATGKPVLLGAAVNGPDPAVVSQKLKGAVDEVILYDRALSAAEIAALAAGGRPRP